MAEPDDADAAHPKDRKPGAAATAQVDPARIPRPLRAALTPRRDAVIARLQDAVSANYLELDELDERLELAMKARNEAELDVLVADLPALPAMQVVATAAPRPASGQTVVVNSAPVPALATAYPALGPEHMTAIFSGIDKKGRRTLPRDMRARAIFGGISLDLREATFQPGVTTIRCFSCFGGVDIRVPPHVRIEVHGSGIFGGFTGDEADGQPESDNSESPPVLRVVGRAVFGGVAVQRKKPGRRG